MIVGQGGPLGPINRISAEGEVADIVNRLTVFMVVRAESREAAVKILGGHPHITIFHCDGVEVMPFVGGLDIEISRGRAKKVESVCPKADAAR